MKVDNICIYCIRVIVLTKMRKCRNKKADFICQVILRFLLLKLHSLDTNYPCRASSQIIDPLYLSPLYTEIIMQDIEDLNYFRISHVWFGKIFGKLYILKLFLLNYLLLCWIDVIYDNCRNFVAFVAITTYEMCF